MIFDVLEHVMDEKANVELFGEMCTKIIEQFCSKLDNKEPGVLEGFDNHDELEYQVHKLEQVLKQHDEYGFHREEFILLGQENFHEPYLQGLSWLEELPFYCIAKLEFDLSNESLFQEDSSLLEFLPSLIEKDEPMLECTSLDDNDEFELESAIPKSLPRADSFDELLPTLVEEDCPLTLEEE